MPHRFILQPYKSPASRFRCPGCNHHDKSFVRYIDTDTGIHIHDSVGRCNRESKCGYHVTPKQFFQQNNITFTRELSNQKPIPRKSKPPSYIPPDTLKQTLTNYHSNYFIQYLTNRFGPVVTQAILNKYFIGSSKHWTGSTIFWQIDINGKIRTGKIMLYNPATGKRVKQPYNHITWVHTVLMLPEFQLKQCLFGEHLLQGNKTPAAIVESEKTAIIASVYLPQFIWLAVGSLSNLTEEKCKVLKGRKCMLFPDLNAFDKWSAKANELKNITNFKVSDLLESIASDEEKRQGLDLVDYF